MWKQEIHSNKFKWDVAYIVFLAVIMLFVFTPYMNFIEAREGTKINDWFLNYLPPKDFSTLLFILIYFTIGFTFFFHIKKPKVFIKVIQVWGTLQLVRMLTLFLFPLEAPEQMIPLIDPIVDTFYGNGTCSVTKDLFFSGHTSAAFLAILFLKPIPLKIIASFLCATIGLLIMWQHVHYSVDVFAAPFFAYATYWGVHKFDATVFRKLD